MNLENPLYVCKQTQSDHFAEKQTMLRIKCNLQEVSNLKASSTNSYHTFLLIGQTLSPRTQIENKIRKLNLTGLLIQTTYSSTKLEPPSAFPTAPVESHSTKKAILDAPRYISESWNTPYLLSNL